MSKLVQEMKNLRENIEFLGESRRAYINDLKNEVKDSKDQTSSMVHNFGKTRAEKAKDAKISRKSFVSNMKSDVCDKLQSFEDDRVRMAKEMEKSLKNMVSDLHMNMNDMFAEFENERAVITKKVNTALQECVSQTKTFVAEMKNDVGEMKAAFSASHVESSKKEKKNRKDFVSNLKDDVSEMKKETQNMMQGFQEEAHDVHEAWNGCQTAKPSNKKRSSGIKGRETEEGDKKKDIKLTMSHEKPVITAKVDEIQNEKKQSSVNMPDDLSLIKGIGSGRQKKLNEAGIYTFEQMAECTPETLRSAIGDTLKLVPVEKWPEEAAKFGRKSI
jgi:predicted flap endonuclease-1-like 5' DNA nuclease